MRVVGLTRGIAGAGLAIACASSAGSSQREAKAPTQTAAPETRSEQPTSEPARVTPRLPKPEWLPEEVRDMLGQRMQRHGRTMMFLLMDVVTLSHEEAAEEADAIAAEPRFGRPAPGEQGTISALLPARFFDLEDQLQAQAHELSRAARANDDKRLVAAYGQLTQSCVGCHMVYLYPDDKPESGD
jgi:hypothetical protein